MDLRIRGPGILDLGIGGPISETLVVDLRESESYMLGFGGPGGVWDGVDIMNVSGVGQWEYGDCNRLAISDPPFTFKCSCHHCPLVLLLSLLGG